jgi:hypothetical protein
MPKLTKLTAVRAVQKSAGAKVPIHGNEGIACRKNVFPGGCNSRSGRRRSLPVSAITEPRWSIKPDKVEAVVQRLIGVARPKKINSVRVLRRWGVDAAEWLLYAESGLPYRQTLLYNYNKTKGSVGR